VPEISRFYGIVVRMYFEDHNPPHVHCEYSGQEALVDIRDGTPFSGQLRHRALAMVAEWVSLHRAELLDLWRRAQALEPLHAIDPLP